MGEKAFQIPCYLTKVTSMYRAWRLVFDSQENIPAQDIAVVLDWMGDKLGYLTFSLTQIQEDDIADLPPLRPEDTKSPAQKMRAILYLLWKQEPEGFKDSESYYRAKMDRIINALKEKLV